MIAKRTIDIFASALALIALTPLFAILAVIIRLDSRGPVFFRQERVGLGGQIFVIWKFRTMVDRAAQLAGHYGVTENDSRITRVGRVLRDWGLDELPQLINILKGDMSLVGPRPTLQYQAEQYSPRQRQRLTMRPGLTGLAQVSGRKSLSWEERIELDVHYVENYSLCLDIKILWRTIGVLLRREGAYAVKGSRDSFGSGSAG